MAQDMKKIYISKVRNYQIDSIRGFAILLVVIGHVIQRNYVDFDNNILFKYIYSFHMPLFMFISGYVMYGKNIVLSRRFYGLVIPFIAWYIVAYIINLVFDSGTSIDFVAYMQRLVISPDWGLWFLLVLFLNTLYLNFIIKYFMTTAIYSEIVGIIIGHLLLQKVPLEILGLGLVKWYFLFFGLGYLAPKYLLKPMNSYLVKIMSIAGFLFLGYYWNRIELPSSIGGIYLSSRFLYLYKIVVPILGIFATFAIIPNKARNYLQDLLSLFGSRSLEIYVTHQAFITYGGVSFLNIIYSFIKAVALSLLTAMILKKNKILNIALYGQR